jgi:hypothetical protein
MRSAFVMFTAAIALCRQCRRLNVHYLGTESQFSRGCSRAAGLIGPAPLLNCREGDGSLRP